MDRQNWYVRELERERRRAEHAEARIEALRRALAPYSRLKHAEAGEIARQAIAADDKAAKAAAAQWQQRRRQRDDLRA